MHYILNYTVYIYSLGDAFIQSYIDAISIYYLKGCQKSRWL